MKRIFVIVFLFGFFFGKAQIVSDSVRPFNCHHDGAIFLDIVPGSLVTWYFDDDSLGLILVNTMQDIVFNGLDTLFTQQCGSYKVLSGVDTSFFFVGCPLGSGGSQINIRCFGDSSGMLKRVAHSGSYGYFYSWFKNGLLYSAGIDDTLLSNLSIGSYKVVINDAVGCLDSLTSTISSPSALILDTTSTIDIHCRGTNSGSVMCSVSGGRQYAVTERYDYYIINLNSGDTVSFLTRDSVTSNFSSVLGLDQITFDSLYAGNYIFSVRDSFDCIIDVIFEINEPIDYIPFGSTIEVLICESDSAYLRIDSVLVDSALGSQNIAFGFAYDLINGIYIDSIYATSGWYDIFVYDSIYLCLDTVPVRFEALYEITVFENITPVSCFGDSTGSVIIDSIIGGNIPYDLQWGGVNNNALSAGGYLLHIVDSIGCLHTKSYNILQADEINPNEVLYPPLCYGDTNGSIVIDITGGTGPLNYYWLNGFGSIDSLFGLIDSIYTLIVLDSLVCMDTFQLNLQSPQSLDLDIMASDSVLTCGVPIVIGAIISGGTYPYSINWSDGDTNQQRVVGAGGAGYFEVEITDANGCLLNDSILITEPSPLEITITHSNITCTEGATATVNVIGGIPRTVGSPYLYLWSNGDTTATISDLVAGLYWVQVTDSCESIYDTIYLDDYELNTIVYYDTLIHIAKVEIESSTTLGPFGYEWLDTLCSSPFERFPSYDSVSPFLCAGCKYFVVTIDSSNNCSVTDTVFVPADNIPLSIIDSNTTTIDTFNLPNIWGTPPYTYLWNDSLWSTTHYGYPCPNPDSSWVEITDNNQCLISVKFLILDLIITLDPADEILECNLENIDIDLQATATGGTGIYSFLWWNGSTENPINLGMSPGNFSVTVTDVNGCKEDMSFKIATMTSECVPNVFTPNGDAINDTWSLEDTFLYEDSEVKVYGRFGRLLFESVGYHFPWDGTNKNGNDVPDGVYFYTIEIGNGFNQINGTVTILR